MTTKSPCATMTREEFNGALLLLRWTASSVAEWCGYSRQAGTTWANGKVSVPGGVAKWLDRRMMGKLDEPPKRI